MKVSSGWWGVILSMSLGASATQVVAAGPACRAVDWLCVSECADQECVDSCLGKGCNAATHRYMACTSAACPEGDAGCSASTAACGEVCQEAFGGVADVGTQGKWSCAAQEKASGESSLPESALGMWVVDGASIPAEENHPDDDKPPMPRSDFKRRLNLLANDCFAFESLLEEPTLGAGNRIAVRLLGRLTYRSGKLTLTPEAREAQSSLCGQSAVRPLASRAMTVKTFKFEREGDELTLTDSGADGQVLHFRRSGTKPKSSASPRELPLGEEPSPTSSAGP